MQVRNIPRLLSSIPQRWYVAVLLLGLVAFSVQYSVKVLGKGSAIIRWQQALRELDQGKDIYNAYIHPNSPMMVVLLRPFAYLPPLLAGLAWFYLKVGLTLVALHWVFRLVRDTDLPWPPWAKVVTVLLALRPILGDLSHGNVNLLILFLLVGCLYAFSRGRELTAGCVLALAVACKVTPALFLPYFLWKRQWKVLAGSALGLVLFLAVVPGLFLGLERNTQLLGSWTRQMIAPYLVRGEVFYSEHNNQSLPGLAMRLATHSPSFSEYIDKRVYSPTEYHNLIDLDPGVVRWFVKACMAGFALLVIWACRTPTVPRPSWRLAAEFSLVVLGMLLFSERTWKHHCVTLLLPFAVLTYYLATARPNPGLRKYLVGTLAASVLLMSSTSISLVGDRAGDLAQVYGAYVWTYLLLGAALVVLLRQPARLSPSIELFGTGRV